MTSVKTPALPPLIAIVGCDGSGKSTVSDALQHWIAGYGPVVAAHLGKQQGNAGRSLASLPLVGPALGRFIEGKASSVRKSQNKNKAPTVFPALVMYAFTLRRVRRFRRMLAQRNQGLIIIADRYPQLDFPDAFDGPDLSVIAEGSDFVHRLALREQAAFEWMTSYRPDLVIRLNVDLDTAHTRKPDHRREALGRKIEITPELTFGGAAIAEIDAAQPLNVVLAEAKSAAAAHLEACGYQWSDRAGS